MTEYSFAHIALKAFPLLLKGAFLTLQISLASIAIGLVLGTILGILNCDRFKHPLISPFISFYVAVVRGTPMFIQLLIVYFALPEALGVDLSPLAAGITTLGLNSTAYLSETIRGGINGVPTGQWDAGFVLGYTPVQSLRFVILPQALKSMLPAVTNELATLVKDSSILMVIGVPELIKVSKDIVARELQPMEIYALAALMYLIMTTIITRATYALENRFK